MTYTRYQVVGFYGEGMATRKEYTTLKDAWATYKAHKGYALADSGYIARVTYKTRLFGKAAIVAESYVISWGEE